MAIVEIADVQGSVPIRIQVADVADQDVRDFYANRETRGIVTKQVTAITRQLYQEAIGLACSCAAQTARQLDAMADKDRPAEFEVTFAMNVDLEVGAKIVNLDSGAQVQVRMQWNR
jgi:hypothetical protein